MSKEISLNQLFEDLDRKDILQMRGTLYRRLRKYLREGKTFRGLQDEFVTPFGEFILRIDEHLPCGRVISNKHSYTIHIDLTTTEVD